MYLSSEKDDPMVLCCNIHCGPGWFHLDCLNLTDLPPPGEDFYCSTECQESEGYIYCICNMKMEGRTVQCHLEEDCRKNEWYHFTCPGFHEDTVLPGEYNGSTDRKCNKNESK